MDTLASLARIVKPTFKDVPGSVELNPNGVRFTRASFSIPPPPMKGGGKRGKVAGFSSASARRLRKTLFECDFRPKGFFVVGACFTLPSAAAAGVGEEVWEQMRRHYRNFDGLRSSVWRKEVQRNGREHYHAVLWFESANPLPAIRAMLRTWCNSVSRRCDDPEAVMRRMIWTHLRGWDETWFEIDSIPANAVARIIDSVPMLTLIDTQGRGVQYLVDHSSKHKRYQSETTGRAWGVWGRESLPRLPVDARKRVVLPQHVEIRLVRILRHLSRYWVPDPRAPFGWRWCRGRRFKKGENILPSLSAAVAVQRWLKAEGCEELKPATARRFGKPHQLELRFEK